MGAVFDQLIFLGKLFANYAMHCQFAVSKAPFTQVGSPEGLGQHSAGYVWRELATIAHCFGTESVPVDSYPEPRQKQARDSWLQTVAKN